MQRPIKPEWLLRQADELAYRHQQGAGQPRNANLRRAVSAAYYAIYHYIALTAAQQLLPNGSDEDRWRLCRHFQHQAVRQICDWVVGPSNPPPRASVALLAVRMNQNLFDAALAFQQLQEARHDADYDHLAGMTKVEALTLIDSARDAIKKLQAEKGGADLERFVAHVSLKASLK